MTEDEIVNAIVAELLRGGEISAKRIEEILNELKKKSGEKK